jgi:hypothetical protein
LRVTFFTGAATGAAATGSAVVGCGADSKEEGGAEDSEAEDSEAEDIVASTVAALSSVAPDASPLLIVAPGAAAVEADEGSESFSSVAKMVLFKTLKAPGEKEDASQNV